MDVRLTEVEHERTMRVLADLRIAELEAELMLMNAKSKVARAMAARDAQLAALREAYPELGTRDFTVTSEAPVLTLAE